MNVLNKYAKNVHKELTPFNKIDCIFLCKYINKKYSLLILIKFNIYVNKNLYK